MAIVEHVVVSPSVRSGCQIFNARESDHFHFLRSLIERADNLPTNEVLLCPPYNPLLLDDNRIVNGRVNRPEFSDDIKHLMDEFYLEATPIS